MWTGVFPLTTHVPGVHRFQKRVSESLGLYYMWVLGTEHRSSARAADIINNIINWAISPGLSYSPIDFPGFKWMCLVDIFATWLRNFSAETGVTKRFNIQTDKKLCDSRGFSEHTLSIPHHTPPRHLTVGRCGGLDVIGPRKLIGSGTIRMCGFVGVGYSLVGVGWRKCVTMERGFEVSHVLRPRPVSQITSCCPQIKIVELSASYPAPFLPASHHVPLWW